MRVSPKNVKREINLLTDPEGTWMALVDQGANQTPASALKSDSSANPTDKEASMAIKQGKGAKKAKVVLTAMRFSKDSYPDKASVDKFMGENNIGNYDIADEDDMWCANSTEDTSQYKLTKSRSTTTKHTGVMAFVAEVEGPAEEPTDEGDEEETEAEGDNAEKRASKATVVDGTEVAAGDKTTGTKSDAATDTVLEFPPNKDGTKKYDYWASYMSNEGSLIGVIRDGIDYDGVPPGVDEVVSALFYTTGNVLSGDSANKEALLKQIGEDFATLTFGLFELFQQATGEGEAASKTAKAFVASFANSIKADPEGARVFTTIKNETADNVSSEAAADEAGLDASAPLNMGGSLNDLISGIVATLKAEVIQPLVERLDTVEATAKEAASKAEATSKETEALAERAPSKKSLSSAADDLGLDLSEQEPAPEVAQRRERAVRDFSSILGLVPDFKQQGAQQPRAGS